MIKEYCRQLGDIRAQKEAFKHSKRKNRAACQQEDRYQAYIIDQMAQQTQLIAASQISHLLGKAIRTQQRLSIESLRRDQPLELASEAPSHQEESITVDCILLKLCCETVARSYQKVNHLAQKYALHRLRNHVHAQKTLKTAILVMKRKMVKSAFRSLTTYTPPIPAPKKPFEEQFSMIGQPIRKAVPLEESDLSFFFEKENNQEDCHSCRKTQDETTTLKEELAKIKQEQAYLRKLLAEKVLELKKYEEEGSRRRVGKSTAEIRNELSIMEMEQQVMGRRICIKTPTQSQSSLSIRGEPLSQELLGKYMREAFQLRQTMDIARQMCLDLGQKVPSTLKREVALLVRTLSTNDEVSVVDDY